MIDCNVRLISNARSFPFHLHILRSLLHLTRHTHTYVPLASYIVPVITSTLIPSSRPKQSTLKPLDLEVNIRAPQQYIKTRIYGEELIEEASYLLAGWLSSEPVQGSVAFPEMVVGVLVMLRKSLKASKTSGMAGGKEVGIVKSLVERIEESSKWLEGKRKGLAFGPGKLTEVQAWDSEIRRDVGQSPLAKYVSVAKKSRDKRRALVEKVGRSLLTQRGNIKCVLE